MHTLIIEYDSIHGLITRLHGLFLGQSSLNAAYLNITKDVDDDLEEGAEPSFENRDNEVAMYLPETVLPMQFMSRYVFDTSTIEKMGGWVCKEISEKIEEKNDVCGI